MSIPVILTIELCGKRFDAILQFFEFTRDQRQMFQQPFLLGPAILLRQNLGNFEIEFGGVYWPTQIVRELIQCFFKIGSGHSPSQLKFFKRTT